MATMVPEASVAFLASCYRNSLARADENSCESVSFPNISTGIYGFPKDLAAETAITTVRYQPTNVARVNFVCFDLENLALYRALT